MRRAIALAAVAVALAMLGAARAAEPIAYLAELHRKGGGAIHVKAGGADWGTARPLFALQAGDQIRVTGEARAVILYHDGARTRVVTRGDSPFTVSPLPRAVTTDQVGVLMGGVSRYLLGKQGPLTLKPAGARNGPGLEGEWPVILAPRNTRLVPGAITFEWDGSGKVRYAIRILGPQGVLWQRADLPPAPVRYPPNAPPLQTGVRYTWELNAPGAPPQRASFELITVGEAMRISAVLALLDTSRADGGSPGTLRLMRVAILSEEGLYDSARRELEATARLEQDDPTPHLLLGHVYDRIGLSGRAALALDRAQRLFELR